MTDDPKGVAPPVCTKCQHVRGSHECMVDRCTCRSYEAPSPPAEEPAPATPNPAVEYDIRFMTDHQIRAVLATRKAELPPAAGESEREHTCWHDGNDGGCPGCADKRRARMSEPTRAEELACHDCREYRALWAERLRVQAEAVDRQNHTAFEAGKREGEEARRLAEQALADAANEINCAGPAAHRIRMLKQEHGAKVERLQGELAGLRAILREFWEHWNSKEVKAAFMNDAIHGGEASQEVCDRAEAIKRKVKEALAPQEGAEKKGTKG